MLLNMPKWVRVSTIPLFAVLWLAVNFFNWLIGFAVACRSVAMSLSERLFGQDMFW
jgi:hypothetical protein